MPKSMHTNSQAEARVTAGHAGKNPCGARSRSASSCAGPLSHPIPLREERASRGDDSGVAEGSWIVGSP